jgi:hypothetical protein
MQTETILNGILALLVAHREAADARPTERILAQAGLSDEHIAQLTGRDPARLAQPPVAAFGHSELSRPAAPRSPGR